MLVRVQSKKQKPHRLQICHYTKRVCSRSITFDEWLIFVILIRIVNHETDDSPLYIYNRPLFSNTFEKQITIFIGVYFNIYDFSPFLDWCNIARFQDIWDISLVDKGRKKQV